MKLIIINYMLWLYTRHIEEDWDVYTRIGKFFIYPVWFIRSALIWLTFPLWIPAYKFENSKFYKHYQEFGKSISIEDQMEAIKQKRINQNIARNNFLIQKQSKGKYNKKF